VPCFLSLLLNYIASLLSEEKNLLGEFVIVLAIIKNWGQVFKRAHEQKAGGTTVRRKPFLCLPGYKYRGRPPGRGQGRREDYAKAFLGHDI
jgi:hypothetical protein